MMSEKDYLQRICVELFGSIFLSTIPLLVSTTILFALNSIVVSPLMEQSQTPQPQVSRSK